MSPVSCDNFAIREDNSVPRRSRFSKNPFSVCVCGGGGGGGGGRLPAYDSLHHNIVYIFSPYFIIVQL